MEDETPTVIGQATAESGDAESDASQWAAVLWVPDPEQRRGWREYYVRKKAAEKPGGRLGFR
jgi:hypothetical protein